MSEIQKTLAERKSKYGDFRGHADLAMSLKTIMRSGNAWMEMPPYMQEALDMVQHKIARILNGDPYYDDSWVDIVGYAQLALDRVRQDVTKQEIERAFAEPTPREVAIQRQTLSDSNQIVANGITSNASTRLRDPDAW